MTIDRAAAMLGDVLEQPETLARLLDAYDRPDGPLETVPALPRDPRIVFTGLGSSRYAALDAAMAIRAAGIASWVEHASTHEPAPPGRDVVLVAISASGRTPEVIEAIERHRGTSLVIGVTNRPDEPVATRADIVLPLLAGREASGVSCRTFQATNAVLGLLAGRLGAGSPRVGDLRPAVDGLSDLIEGRAAWLAPAADLLDRVDAIGFIGGAGELGLVEQAALMLREGPRLAATAHEAGDWPHTAIYTALPGYRAVVVAGTPYDETLVRTIRGRGGEVLAVGAEIPGAALTIEAPASTGSVQRLVLSAVGDLLAAELWSRTTGNASDLELPTQG